MLSKRFLIRSSISLQTLIWGLSVFNLPKANFGSSAMSVSDELEMEYRLLGKSGVKVSCLGMGTWATFSEKGGMYSIHLKIITSKQQYTH